MRCFRQCTANQLLRKKPKLIRLDETEAAIPKVVAGPFLEEKPYQIDHVLKLAINYLLLINW